MHGFNVQMQPYYVKALNEFHYELIDWIVFWFLLVNKVF